MGPHDACDQYIYHFARDRRQHYRSTSFKNSIDVQSIPLFYCRIQPPLDHCLRRTRATKKVAYLPYVWRLYFFCIIFHTLSRLVPRGLGLQNVFPELL